MSQPKESTIFLFSSNRRPRYFDDCLQALMLPREMVLHFRYRNEWLDPTLLELITKGKPAGRDVMICYLYQEYENAQWQPKSIRPLRYAKIVEAVAHGPEVHIYFSVLGYPLGQASLEKITTLAEVAFRKEGKLCFASTGDPVSTDLVSSESVDAEAFPSVIEQLQKDEIRSVDQNDQLIQMDPLFYRVQGICQRDKTGMSNVLTPSSDAGVSDREHGYLLTNSNPLELRIQFHQPKWSNIANQRFILELKADDKRFSIPQDAQMPIASPYDENAFYILPLRDNVGWITRIGFQGVDHDGQVTDSITKFSALVRATPILSPIFVRSMAALTPSITTFVALVALLISLFGNSNSSLWNLPWPLWLAIGILGLIMVAIPTINAYIGGSSKVTS